MILYAVAAEVSLGRLFLAGIGPGLLLVALFSLYAAFRFRKEYAAARLAFDRSGTRSAYLDEKIYTLREKVEMLPRVLPFVILLIGVMVALYGGYGLTPSETAGLGAVLALLLIALIYRVCVPFPRQADPRGDGQGIDDADVHYGHVAVLSYVMSYLHISQSAAEWIVALHLSRWVLLTAILFIVVVLGFFFPPVSIILMTAPIILPPLKAAGFDLIWFGVLMTIVMEMGLIHPPVGPQHLRDQEHRTRHSTSGRDLGVLPFVGLMFVAIVLICIFPASQMVSPTWSWDHGSECPRALCPAIRHCTMTPSTAAPSSTPKP